MKLFTKLVLFVLLLKGDNGYPVCDACVSREFRITGAEEEVIGLDPFLLFRSHHSLQSLLPSLYYIIIFILNIIISI